MFEPDPRARGVLLRTLDLTVLTQQAGDLPEAEGKEISLGYAPYAMTQRGDDLYVICHEGVGWKVTEDAPLQVDLYLSSPGTIAILPTARARLTPEEVRTFATGGTVDLADHIRTFGDRLESNFWTWHRTLTAVSLTKKES